MMLEPAAISLGSNLGERGVYLSRGRYYLEAGGKVRVLKASSVYETEPVGGPAQPWYLNQVLLIQTELAPGLLLAWCRRVEDQFGRARRVPLGPRTLDIDILFCGQRVIATPFLRLPHPAIAKRRCILQPLVELGITWIHPTLGADPVSLLAGCRDQSIVRLVLPELKD